MTSTITSAPSSATDSSTDDRFFGYTVWSSGLSSSAVYCGAGSTMTRGPAPNSAVWCSYYEYIIDRSCSGRYLMMQTTDSETTEWAVATSCDAGAICSPTRYYSNYPAGSDEAFGTFYGCSTTGDSLTQLNMYMKVTGTGADVSEATATSSTGTSSATGTSNTLSTATSTSSGTITTSTGSSSNSLSTGTILGIVFGIIGGAIVFFSTAALIYYRQRRNQKSTALSSNDPDLMRIDNGPSPGIQEMYSPAAAVVAEADSTQSPVAELSSKTPAVELVNMPKYEMMGSIPDKV